MRRLFLRGGARGAAIVTVTVWLALAVAVPAGQDAADEASIEGFLADFEAAVRAGDRAGLGLLVDTSAAAEAPDLLAGSLLHAGVSRVVVRERDRALLAGSLTGPAVRLLVEVFVEAGDVGRIATFRLYLRRHGPGPTWRIVDAERLTSVEGLYRLRLDEATQYAVTNLRVRAEDFELSLPRGSAFLSRIESGTTALVLIGDGTLRFAPRPAAEKIQVRLFGGDETLLTPFTAALLRLNPLDYDRFLNPEALRVAGRVDSRQLDRASQFFQAQVGRSYGLDLQDLSRDLWSLVPGIGDLLADVRTRRLGTLTYARASSEAEDISLFDRDRRRNISVYPSLRRLEQRGRSYDEDALSDIDVIEHTVDATYVPAREWMEGVAQVRLRVRAPSLATITLRLAESLTVHSVRSERHGRLLALRVRGQNNIVLSLPSALARDDEITLTVRYSGRLAPQPPDREVVQPVPTSPFGASDMPLLVPEPRWVFSNRTYWHPQNTISDFATGVMRLSVPAPFQVVASGDPLTPIEAAPARGGDGGLRTFEFAVRQPVRYLSWAISQFQAAGRDQATLSEAPAAPTTGDGGEASRPSLGGSERQGVFYRAVDVDAVANPRQVSRARSMLRQAVDILGFYGSLVDDFPYPSLALTIVDHEVPGGHSPAYFALVHQPLPTTPFTWRGDPVYFDEYPLFFLAHELAHQFWGQAVGWKSYHEQWISEGFAQYFALLYAERHGGPSVLRSVLGRMRTSAIAQASQGPITLGYRLGHVRNDSRVFRAVVYNKSAVVLHMLRRLIGDEAFFTGLRDFYQQSRFTKAGTEDVRAAFEAASGRSLEPFFERWIYEFAIPRVRVTGRTTGDSLQVSFLQPEDLVHEMPVTVSLRYADGSSDTVTVTLADARVDRTLPLRGALRSWEVNDDRATLAEFVR